MRSLVRPLYRPTSGVTLHAVLTISQPCNNHPYSISLFTNLGQMWGREGPTKCQFYKFLSCTVLQNSRSRFSETDNKKPGDYFLNSLKASVYVQSSITERNSICLKRKHKWFVDKSFLLFCFVFQNWKTYLDFE